MSRGVMVDIIFQLVALTVIYGILSYLKLSMSIMHLCGIGFIIFLQESTANFICHLSLYVTCNILH